MRQPAFICQALTENCHRVLARREHVLLGVSPGNSYFSEARLTDLLRWLARAFERIDVVIPDAALHHTLLAAGYQAPRAVRKVHGIASRLRNRVTRAREAAEVPAARFGLHLLSELTGHGRYRMLLGEAEEAFAHDGELRESGMGAARRVLRAYLHDTEPTEEQAERAARYLLAELPFLLDTPGILDVSSSTAVYHHRIEFVDQLYAGQGALRASQHQAFAVVRPRAGEEGTQS